jgi:hypothetical protein
MLIINLITKHKDNEFYSFLLWKRDIPEYIIAEIWLE